MGFGPTVFVKSLSLASDHLLPRGDFAGIMDGWELELLPDTWLGSLGALVFSLGLALTRSALTLGGSRVCGRGSQSYAISPDPQLMLRSNV